MALGWNVPLNTVQVHSSVNRAVSVAGLNALKGCSPAAPFVAWGLYQLNHTISLHTSATICISNKSLLQFWGGWQMPTSNP